jgi:hypothetical protein
MLYYYYLSSRTKVRVVESAALSNLSDVVFVFVICFVLCWVFLRGRGFIPVFGGPVLSISVVVCTFVFCLSSFYGLSAQCYTGIPHQCIWPPPYSWNIIESGVITININTTNGHFDVYYARPSYIFESCINRPISTHDLSNEYIYIWTQRPKYKKEESNNIDISHFIKKAYRESILSICTKFRW